MMPKAKEIHLLGYTDRLSARPGETLEFKVSSLSKQPFSAKLTRSISADPNPQGIGIVEQDASEYFAPQKFKSVYRPFFPGSYAIAKEAIGVEAHRSIEISVIIFPTRHTLRSQTLVNIGTYDLQIDEQGAVCLKIAGIAVAINQPIKLHQWYEIKAHITPTKIVLEQGTLGRYSSQETAINEQDIQNLKLLGMPCVGACVSDQKVFQHFNGKIEAPKILVDGAIFCEWDFSQQISTTKVMALRGPDLNLVNYPARAMTGSLWDGSEMNWNHQPSHYAAVHFHEDDIYDFNWDTDFSFTIPNGMLSGIYIMHLECEGFEDAIPFFVCPPLGKPQARLCVLVSTFTYTVYGNHARSDYDANIWQARTKSWGGYPHNPVEYPDYGLSTYNCHSDGSGICHASCRRPLFNLRPGYITFGDTACSGLRHFPADSHLMSWLHHKSIDFDIVTDEQLHKDGVSAIVGYQTLTTATHPEYHTEASLNALHDYRDGGGNLLYLGGNGFYWRIHVHPENDSLLEIRRAEDGIRAWASNPGEYYSAFEGTYGGLWRRNARPPQALVGIGFVAQGTFLGDPYRRVCHDPEYDWVFEGIEDTLIGDFGYSGNGAAGFELDHMDFHLGTPENTIHLAQSVTRDTGFILAHEEQLTHLANLTGESEQQARHADIVYIEYPSGGIVFAVGSITFCGSLPWNQFDNNISTLLHNILRRLLASKNI